MWHALQTIVLNLWHADWAPQAAWINAERLLALHTHTKHAIDREPATDCECALPRAEAAA